MSDNNETPNDISGDSQEQLDFDDLDAFSSSFFGEKKSAEEPAKAPEKEDENVEAVDDETVDDQEEADVTESDDADDQDDSETEEVKPGGKKPSRFQERINELTTARREAERREAALLARLEALEVQKDGSTSTAKTVSIDDTPTPADQNDDGSDKYPLGEFDPNFIRDLTKYTIAEAQKEAAAERTRTESEQAEQRKAEALHNEWKEKQGPAQERYPDYGEKVASLEEVFADVDPAYGEYLAQTVMAMDKGPDVLYYLSNHPDEARSIVKQGGVKAVISLGRLESRFFEEDRPQPKTKVSTAPTPPPTNKGSAGGRRSVSPDTDDLDAFANEFFKRKK